MQNNSKKKYFAAANTTDGFISYYDDIFGGLKKLYVIKGGPGTGKSRLMMDIGSNAEQQGHNVEYYYCSFDPNSLDGVIINEKIAVIDGTSPHVYEPRLPGAIDEIIDLSRFWESSILKDKRKQLQFLSEEKSRCFNLTYLYLSALGKIYSFNRYLFKKCIKQDIFDSKMRPLLQSKNTNNCNFKVKLNSSFGQKGLVNFPISDDLVIRTISISDCFDTLLISDLIDNLVFDLKRQGFIRTYFLSPFEKNKCDGFITSNQVAVLSEQSKGDYDISEFMTTEINNIRSFLKENAEIKDTLISCAHRQFSKAAELHSEIEKIYVSAMNFDAKEKYTEELIEKMNFS